MRVADILLIFLGPRLSVSGVSAAGTALSDWIVFIMPPSPLMVIFPGSVLKSMSLFMLQQQMAGNHLTFATHLSGKL